MKLLPTVASCFAPVSVAFAALSVDFEVKNPSGSASAGHPVSVVFPLPEGAFSGTDGLRIVNSEGTAVPAQMSALNRWWLKDGSIRNLHVNFLADLQAGGSSTYSLREGAAHGGRPLTLEESAAAITVVTGPLKFTLRKDSVRLLEQAWLDRDGDGSFEDAEAMLEAGAGRGGVLTTPEGTAVNLASLANAKIDIEERGPVRAVIKVEVPTAPPGNPFGYKFRLYAWQGRPDLQIDFTLKNDILGPTGAVLYFDDFSLLFDPRLDPASSTLRFGAGDALAGPAAGGARLLQASASAFAVSGSVTGSGDRSEGWMDMSQSGRGGIQVAVRDAWQQFPKGLEVDASGRMAVRLWPQGGEDGAGIYWLGDMQYKTYSVFLRFHGDDESAAALSAYARLVNLHPAPVIPVSWYADTRQAPNLLGYMRLRNAATPHFDGPNASDTLGWRAYWNNGRKGTIETGSTPTAWTGDHFMASGDPQWLYRILRWARHSADIRPTHLYGYVHPMSKNWQGFVAGGYDWDSWRRTPAAYTLPNTVWDRWKPYDDQHAWVHEMEWAYYYTGDRLFYDNLCNLGEIWKASLDMNGGKRQTVYARALAFTFELVRIQHTLSGDAGALALMAKAIDTTALANQNGYLGALNGDNLEQTFSSGTQTFQLGMVAQYMASLYRELPEGVLKRRLFGVLAGIGDYFTVHSWADDNRGIGRRPTEKATPYYGNEDMGDVPAILYVLTGRADYKEKTGRIGASLGAWWTDWKGGRAGRLVSYVVGQTGRDTTRPAPVSDLKAYRAEGRTDIVLLAWTAPQDARRFDVRGSPRNVVERVAAPADTATQVNWWKAVALPPPSGAPIQGRHWTVATGPNIASWKFVVRSFDSDGDEANMSLLSNQAAAECCFNPDTLPAASKPRQRPRKGEIRLLKERQGRIEILAPEMGPGEVLEVSLLDVGGRIVAGLGELSTEHPALSLDGSGFQPGLYWVRARGQGRTVSRKLFLQ